MKQQAVNLLRAGKQPARAGKPDFLGSQTEQWDQKDEFFVLCDYREGARDSRYFGPVSEGEIKGKVITVVRRSGL